jgi:predicted acylesterase/phospholipase RssA
MKTVLQNLSHALRLIWLLFPAILFIILSLIAFSSLSQGQDVLLIAAEGNISASLLVFGITFFAFICWYTSRLIMYKHDEDAHNHDNPSSTFWMVSFPRILGYLCFLTIQISIIVHPYFKSDYDALIITILIVLQILIYTRIHHFFKEKTIHNKLAAWLPIIALAVVVIVSLIFSRDGAIRQNFMIQLFGLWLVQTAFLVWNYIRTQFLKKDTTETSWKYFKVFGLKVVRIPEYENLFFKRFNLLITIPLALYIIAIFSIPFSRILSAFNIAILSFSILVGFLHIVTIIGSWRKINLHFILFAVAVIMGFFLSPYALRKTKVDTPAYNKRTSLKDYACEFINSRRDAINQSDSFPLYFVLSDGGASRSGYWVAGALGKLETETKGKFSNHLFCLSGASGGSVGNTVFYSLLDEMKDNPEYKNIDLSLSARSFLRSDFLSITLSHMLGPDYFRHILPLGLADDRGGALERAMENPNFNDTVGRLFAKHYSEYVNSFSAKKMPLFFINTTRVKDGSPGVISNIKLERWFTPRMDVLSMIDVAGKDSTPFGDINLSTAAVLSSRFPYLSPAANIDNEYFVDGGYFDNSGAGIAMETIAGLKELFATDKKCFPDSITEKLKFCIIHLSNSQGGVTEPSRMHPIVNDLFTPLITLAGSYGQQTNVNNDRLMRFVATYANNNCSDCWTVVNLYDRNPEIDKDTTPFSMNWVISDTTLHRMDFRLGYNKNLAKLINDIDALKE